MANCNRCILCGVETCTHHNEENYCELDSIKVAPRYGCHSGDCDESMCASYKTR